MKTCTYCKALTNFKIRYFVLSFKINLIILKYKQAEKDSQKKISNPEKILKGMGKE